MSTQPTTSAKPKKGLIDKIGWTFILLLTILFIFSGVMKLLQPESFLKEFQEKLGYPQQTAFPIGLVEIVCALIYFFPRTHILGAILLTGYMGGAIATHVRVNDPFVAQAIIGMVVWLGPFLRESKLRQIIFWR